MTTTINMSHGADLSKLSPNKASAHDVFTQFSNGGAWPTQGVSFFVGLVGNVFAMFGCDSAVHVRDKSKRAGRFLLLIASMQDGRGNQECRSRRTLVYGCINSLQRSAWLGNRHRRTPRHARYLFSARESDWCPRISIHATFPRRTWLHGRCFGPDRHYCHHRSVQHNCIASYGITPDMGIRT